MELFQNIYITHPVVQSTRDLNFLLICIICAMPNNFFFFSSDNQIWMHVPVRLGLIGVINVCEMALAANLWREQEK